MVIFFALLAVFWVTFLMREFAAAPIRNDFDDTRPRRLRTR
jgi:hypothetical protein